MSQSTQKKVYLISDSTGELGERFVNALATQFVESIKLKKFSFVQDQDEVKSIFSKIVNNHQSVLFHTAISKDVKAAIENEAKKIDLPAFDLTDPPTNFLMSHLGLTPDWNLKTLHPIDESYEKRIDAIEFTIDHDDGAGEKGYGLAEVILVGPSRVSKTPTSMYLAMKGYRVANIPLVAFSEPQSVAKLKNSPKVFGFLIQPAKLAEIRQKRLVEFGADVGDYAELSSIRREVMWAAELYKKYGWQTIDVTDRAIEETAAIILKKHLNRVQNKNKRSKK